MAGQCRNALICFACNKSGHRARECTEVHFEDKSDKKEKGNTQNYNRVPYQPQNEKEEMVDQGLVMVVRGEMVDKETLSLEKFGRKRVRVVKGILAKPHLMRMVRIS